MIIFRIWQNLLIDWIERVRERQLLRVSSSIRFMQLGRWCFHLIQEGNIGRGNVLGFGRWWILFWTCEVYPMRKFIGSWIDVDLKFRKKGKAGNSYWAPSRHQWLGIQRWPLPLGSSQCFRGDKGQVEGNVLSGDIAGSHRNTKERKHQRIL